MGINGEAMGISGESMGISGESMGISGESMGIKRMDKSVIVIGAGLAGMMAAYAARKEGAEVTLIDRGSIGIGTNSALANGVFSGPTSAYSAEEYIRDTLEIGRMINRPSFVDLIAREAPGAFEFLRSLGLDMVESSKIYHVVRSPQPDVLPGIPLVKKLSETVRQLSNITILTGIYVTDILTEESKAYGVRGLDKTGKETTIYAPAVILATGGAGAVYQRNDNQKNIMGQGYYLSARAGLELWDMEFVQYIPIVMAEPGLPSMLLNSPFPDEARLVNASGEDILKKHGIDNLNYAFRNQRDELSILLFEEGNTSPVYMDYRSVPFSLWDAHPLSLLKKIKFDFRTKPVAVTPGAHFFMGGVKTDECGQTSLPGLFACGEVVWGLHGANRRGGNALTECMVLGKIAGNNAAKYALTHGPSASDIKGVSKRTSMPDQLESHIELRELRRQIREIAWNYGGVLRHKTGLKEGIAKIEDVFRQLQLAQYEEPSKKILKEDLISASFVVKAVLTASLSREESRGSFNRKDFPKEDNANWLKNSCLAYDFEIHSFSVSHHKVVNTVEC